MAVIEQRKTKDGRVSYRAKIRLKGFPAQTSTHTRLIDARRWASQTEAALREGRYFKDTEAKKRTLGELIDVYIRTYLPSKKKSELKQGAQLKWWKNELGHLSLADVTPAILAEKKNELLGGITYRGTKRTPSTVNRYLAALSHAFSIAVRELGWIDDNPLRKVTKPKESRGRVRYLDEKELARLLAVCKESSNQHLYPIVFLAISTGMRHGEIVNLTWQSVDFGKKRIILHETKNGERRSVPLSDIATEILRKLSKKSPSSHCLLFPSLMPHKGNCLQKPDGVRVLRFQKPVQIRSAWETALQKANILDFRFHDLRHCAASYLLMSGASLAELAEISVAENKLLDKLLLVLPKVS